MLPRRVPILLSGALVLAGFGMTGCTATPTPAAPPPPTAAQPTPTGSADPAPSDAPVPTVAPVDIDCATLVPVATLTFYGSEFVPMANPLATGVASDFAATGGVTCGWVSPSTNQRVTLAVVARAEDALTAAKNDLVMSSNWVPTYEVEGYFTAVDGLGTANAFADPYWIWTQSDAYLEPGDALPVVSAAIAALRG